VGPLVSRVRLDDFPAYPSPEWITKAVRLVFRLGVLAMIGLPGCRHREAAPGAQSEAILAARTLGLAYLQSDQLAPAESAFRKVIALAPDQALGHANLGLVQLRQGRYREAESEIRRAARLDPTSDDIALMLARVLQLTGRPDDAAREIDGVLRRTPGDVRALYALAQLAGAASDSAAQSRRAGYLRQLVEQDPANLVTRLELIDDLLERGATDDAVAQLETLQRQLPALPPEATRFFERALAQARESHAVTAGTAAATFHHFMETTPAYQAARQRLQGARGALVGVPVLTFNPNLAPPAEGANAVAAAIRFTDVTTAVGLVGVPADSQADALAAGDYDGNGSPDVFVGGHLFGNELGRSTETTERAGIRLPDRAVAAAFGDYDNDGHLDLYVATAHGGGLFRNQGDSTFRDVTAAAGLGGTPPAATALFLDLDHDGDLDLFLTGPGGNRAYRNTLVGPFQDVTAEMGLAGSTAGSRDAAFGDFDGDGHTDLVVMSDQGRLTLYRNLGQGRFQDATAASGLADAGPATGRGGAVAVGDYDNDGFVDLLLASGAGSAPVMYRNQGDGVFEVDRAASTSLRALRGLGARGAQFFDYDNDGHLDLVVAGRPAASGGSQRTRGVFLFRNDGTGRFTDHSSILPGDVGAARRVTALDYDRDGDLDLLLVGWDGRPRLLLNDGGNANQYVQVQLTALRAGNGKNNDFGIGSTLELRAGKLYQVQVVTGPVTHFGLGRHVKADVLRVRWPNGVSQTVYYPGTDEDVLEQQILKGSCPFLYAWNGRRFDFVTDVMWRSALGMPLGIMGSAGTIAAASPHASQEYMRVPSNALVPRNGRYLLQLTEELWETAYLDRLRLLAVDHPDSVDVYVNERFVPPAPGQAVPPPPRLYQVARPHPPIRATDEHGRDLLPMLRARDDAYVAGFTPARYQGLTAMHDLILDLGDVPKSDSVFLFLTGWIFPTDASINLALAQAPTLAVVAPSLQVPDARGGWRTVVPDLGFPAGKNKTVIVDLTGAFPPADHRVRIRTNMEIYWDQAFLASTAAASPVTLTTLAPVSADLHYRGFSRSFRKGGRYGPPWFAYDDVSTEPRWAPIPGRFTRYGDVRPLLDSADDRYVVFGPGDEISLAFDASAAPPLRPGWTRDYLIYTDAWMKDADLNTASGGTVDPLPFHGMSRYPYGPNEAYPGDAAHRRYIESFNTRRVGPARP
jgi:tetratricopeptide (TPR) repeat protein